MKRLFHLAAATFALVLAGGLLAGCELEDLCGNGTKDVGEECDDGNTDDGDGCDHLCLIEGPSEGEGEGEGGTEGEGEGEGGTEGEGEGPVDGPWDLGVDASRRFADFTPADVSAFCAAAARAGEELRDQVQDDRDLKQGVCMSAGMMSAAFAAMDPDANPRSVCEGAVNECLHATPPPPDPEEETCEDRLARYGDCTATVGDLESCLNAKVGPQLEALRAMADITCAEVAAAIEAEEDLPGVEEVEEPAVCKELEAACPGLTADE